MKQGYAVWVMIFGLMVGVGCLEGLAECEVEEGGSVRCEDGTEIHADDLPEDAQCVTDGREVRCDSGDRFEVNGEDGRETPGQSDDGEQEESSPGGWETCVATSGRIDCVNGEAVTDEAISGDEGECRWGRRPGEGETVACEDGSEWTPDEAPDDVTCAWDGEFVECSDGTVVQFEEQDCEPEFVGGTEGYSIQCGDESEEVEDVEQSWCGYPEGEFVLEDATAEEALGCRFIFGDLTVEGEQPVEIYALEGIEVVTGNLNVVETEGLELIPPGQLWRVGEGVRVIDNQDMVALPWLDTVEFVDGGIEITGNEALQIIELWWLQEAESLTISDNPQLIELEIGERAELEGAFLLTDNESFPMCDGQDWLMWGEEIADGGAYVGGLSDDC